MVRHQYDRKFRSIGGTLGFATRSIGVRGYLIALMMAVLVPVTAFAAGIVIYLWSVQRDQIRERHEAAVANLAAVVSGEIESAISRLQLLSTSPLVRDRDLEALAALAREVLARTPQWTNVLMVAIPSGEQVFNVAAQDRTLMPVSGDRPHQRTAVRTKRPTVSPLFVGRATGRPLVEVVVPVVEGDAARYLLTATLSLDHLAQTLAARVNPQHVAIIVDQDQRIIARTRDGPQYIGKHPVPDLLAKMRAALRGWDRFVAFEGDPVYTAWAPAAGWGWSVAYGLAAAPIEQALLRSLALLGALGLAVVVAAVSFAWFASRRILDAIDGAASAATLAASGQLPPQARSGVREVDQLHESLRVAAARVATETAERTQAERERDELIEAERAARSRAEAESRSKDEFLATLGHELRNPLSAISNAIRLLEATAPRDPKARLPIDIIARQAKHQQRLLDDLLDVARVTTGRLKLKKSPQNLAQCVQEALASLSTAGRTANHNVETSLEEVWVDADATRIEQIAVNLVGNALKFTPAGGTILVSTKADGDVAVLRVRDSGLGIAPATLPRVFDLFAHYDPTPDRSAGGLGIGLTLVRRVAELHGGTVTASSEGVGRGAEFCVRLPRLRETASFATERAAVAERREPRDLLVVEDNPDVRLTVRASLELAGHRVVACATAREALESIAAHAPDVAIVDIGLPDISGLELARQIREHHGNRIALIAMTGFGTIHDEQGWFDVRLVKPVDGTELATIVALLRTPAPRAA
jgi:signal transduction histidine kinase/CheY-like chemotaxis protein